MTIDIYTHYFPREYARALQQVSAGRVHPDTGDIGELLRLFPTLCNDEDRLKIMDKHGVSIQVLTPLPVPAHQFLNTTDWSRVESLVSVANDSLAEVVASSSHRFEGVALLSFHDAGFAVTELVRAVKKLQLRGAMLFTNIDGKPIDSNSLDPLYQAAVDLDVPLWLHPVSWNYFDWIRQDLLWQIFGWPFDTTLAMARLVYGGVMARFSKLKIITHHSGGMMPPLVGRIQDIFDQTKEYAALYSGETTDIPQLPNPLSFFHQFYADTAVSGWLPALRCSFEFFGATHLVFGSDYPFSPERGERFVSSNLKAIGQLELPSKDRDAILHTNACSLLKQSLDMN